MEYGGGAMQSALQRGVYDMYDSASTDLRDAAWSTNHLISAFAAGAIAFSVTLLFLYIVFTITSTTLRMVGRHVVFALFVASGAALVIGLTFLFATN